MLSAVDTNHTYVIFLLDLFEKLQPNPIFQHNTYGLFSAVELRPSTTPANATQHLCQKSMSSMVGTALFECIRSARSNVVPRQNTSVKAHLLPICYVRWLPFLCHPERTSCRRPRHAMPRRSVGRWWWHYHKHMFRGFGAYLSAL